MNDPLPGNNPLPASEPWERQPGEPNLWFARFESYRLQGPNLYKVPLVKRK